jgi:uncharacterized membrane protein YfcA
MTAFYILAVPAGLLIGLSLGALGGGGSILTVPALVYVLGQSAHGATTASLVIVGVTSLAGMAAHARAGRVRFGSGLIFGGLGTVGSLAGARLSAGVNSDVLLAAFAVLVLIAAGAMLARAAGAGRPRRRRGGTGWPRRTSAGVRRKTDRRHLHGRGATRPWGQHRAH